MDLKELGLSPYEQKAYETLIRFGKLSASEIAKESGVSYGKIYEVLGRLETKGLVQVIPEKTKKFIPGNPQNLIELINKKKKQLNEIEKKVIELKEIYTQNEEEPVIIARGKKSWPKIRNSLKRGEKFNYNIKWTAEYDPKTVRLVKEELKKGVKYKTLTRLDAETKENIKKWLKIHPEHKAIKNKGVAIGINDKEVLIVLIKQNTSLIIRDEALIEILKEMYEALYKTKKYITNEDLEKIN